MTDTFTGYEKGLTRLLERLGKEHPRYDEALTLQARLLENIYQARQYGDTETRRAERAQIVDRLNQLALETLGTDFNSISESAQGNISNSQTSSSVQKMDNRSGGVYFEGGGPVQIQGDVVSGDQTKSVHETHFHGHVTGPVHTGSGDIRVGSMQIGADVSLETLLAALRQVIAERLSGTKRSRATKQVNQMFSSISKGKPDLDLIESTLEWFQKHQPSLTDAVESAILHPAVARAVESAENLTIIEFERRFGRLSDEEEHR